MDDDGWYLKIGTGMGWVAALLTFLGAWSYCAITYGFLFGFGLGWLPAGILAVIVGWLARFLWGPALVLIAALMVGIIR